MAPRSRAVWLHRVTLIVLVVGSFAQRPGQTTFDTKLDLTEGVGAFLGRAAHMWNPASAMGEVQNQAYGYFFPQGAFFLLGDLAGLPPWIVQRAWTALLLVLAYEGTRRLVRALYPDMSPAAGIVAGLAYALAPRLVGVVGTISGEALPTVFLPWTLLPLVLVRRGRLGPRVAGLLSACAVLAMSGVNATGVIAVLPLPFLVLASGWRLPGGKRLALWWGTGVVLATAWWVVPLLALGGYSPPFLDYIETSAASTRPLTWFNALRGADHWVGYLGVGGEPWWPASYLLSVSAAGVVITSAVAAIGVVGICRRDLPLRGVWISSFLLGLVCLVAGHAGDLGSPIAGSVQSLLDGALTPLRNVHKVDPLVRLPLAVAIGHLCHVLLTGRLRGWGRLRLGGERRFRIALAALVVVTVAAGGFPILEGQLRKPGWSEIPDSWHQAVARAEREQGTGRVLVLPGTGSAEQTWGSTIDEPLQPLASKPWAVRNQIPLAPGTTIRLLDSIEDLISTGRGSTGLAPLLARAGVSVLLVRNDLRAAATDAPPNSLVVQTLDHSPGLTKIAGFGAVLGGPAVVLYRVDRPVDQIAATPLSAVTTMAGGPEDLLPALESGQLPPESPVLFGDDPDLQGDAYRLVERKYGQVHRARTDVRSPDDPRRTPNRSSDYAAVPGQRPVVRTQSVIKAMNASSSAAYVDALGPAVPAAGPYAAVDGDPTTAWLSDRWHESATEWIEFTLRQARPVAAVRIATGTESHTARVATVTVDTGVQRRKVTVDARTGVAEVALNQTPVDTIRVTLTRADGSNGPIAVADMSIPGLVMSDALQLPDSGAAGATGFTFTSAPASRACLPTAAGAWCDLNLAAPAEEPAGLRRTFHLDTSGRFRISGAVMPVAGQATLRLMEPLLGDQVRVRSNSTFADDPLVAPQRAFDGRPETVWLSAPSVEAANLRLRWRTPRTLTRIRFVSAQGARTPVRALLEAGDERREVDLRHGFGTFAPLRTDRVRITFEAGGVDDRPLGVAELVIDGLKDQWYQPSPGLATGAVCGFGPPIIVDGRAVPTRVKGQLRSLDGLELSLEPCDDDGEPLQLSAGDHELSTVSTGQFAVTRLALEPVAESADNRYAGDRPVSIVEWRSNSRTVRIAPGPESVLRVPENVNPGWRATLKGRALRAVDVDGWQQGYVVPAGSGGLVKLTYGPDRTYRVGLLGGGLLAVLLLMLTFVFWRRDRGGPTEPWPESVVVDVVPRHFGRRVARGWWVCLGAGLLGGPAPAMGVALSTIFPVRWAPRLAVLGAVAAAAAGWLVAVGDLQGRAGTLIPAGAAGIAVGALATHAVFARPGGTITARRRVFAAPWRGWVGAIALLAIVVQTTVRGWIVLGGFYTQDDYRLLTLGRDSTLDVPYLFQEYAGHVWPGEFLIAWLTAHGRPDLWAISAGSMLALQLAAAMLMWLILCRILPGTWLRMPLLMVFLFSPLTLGSLQWWAQALGYLPVTLFLLLAVWALLVGLQDNRWWAWPLAWTAFVLGVSFQERALLIPLVLAGVAACHYAREFGWSGCWIAFRRHLWFWMLLGCTAVLLLVGHLLISGSAGGGEARTVSSVVHAATDLVFRTLLPGLWGGPWTADVLADSSLVPPLGVVIPVAVLSAVLVAITAWRGRAGAQIAWFLLLCYVAADVALLYAGRLQSGLQVGLLPRYAADIVPVAVICGAWVVKALQRRRGVTVHRRFSRPLLAVGLAAYLAGAAVTTNVVAPSQQNRDDRSYVDNLVAELRRNPTVTVYDGPPPEGVMVFWFGKEQRLSTMTAVLPEQVPINVPGPDLRVVAKTGKLVAPALIDTSSFDLPSSTCGVAVGSRPAGVDGPGGVRDDYLVRIEYFGADDAFLTVTIDGVEQTAFAPAGAGKIDFVVSRNGPGVVRMQVDRDVTLCVTEMLTGYPAVPADD